MAQLTKLVVQIDKLVHKLEGEGHKFDDIIDSLLDYVELCDELRPSESTDTYE